MNWIRTLKKKLMLMNWKVETAMQYRDEITLRKNQDKKGNEENSWGRCKCICIKCEHEKK